MDRYLDAVKEQGVSLFGQWIPRARFGLHLQLARLHQEFEQAGGANETAYIIQDYLALCNLNLIGTRALFAFACLLSLNNWQWELPFMTGPKEEHKPAAYEYKDRTWAYYVHKLASRYGWTRDYIFGLWPEEIACYLQEIFVSEFNEYEDQYRLSELAYVYDKHSKQSKYQPISKPYWMAPPITPPIIRIHKAFLPAGLVIRGDGSETTYH